MNALKPSFLKKGLLSASIASIIAYACTRTAKLPPLVEEMDSVKHTRRL